MSTREAVVLEARRWIGTPYVHQGSCQRGGTDCLGLIRGVWRAIMGHEPQKIPPYSVDWMEISQDDSLLIAASKWLNPKPKSSNEVGDVLLFCLTTGGPPRHLGISAQKDGNPSFIHAYSTHCVLETSLSIPWQRRIVARFDFPTGEK